MSDHRNLVTFYADFPDGDRAIAEAVAVALRKKECAATPLSQQGSDGGAFDATLDNLTIRCELQPGAAWRLVSTIKSTLPQLRFADANQAFQWFLYLVHDALATDGRFSQIRWYTQADFEAGKTDAWFHVP